MPRSRTNPSGSAQFRWGGYVLLCSLAFVLGACVETRHVPLAGPTQKAELEKTVGFPIVTPCWLPAGLATTPLVDEHRAGRISLAYEPPGFRGPDSPLNIIELRSAGDRLATFPAGTYRGLEITQIDGFKVEIGELAGNTGVRWFMNGVAFDVSGTYTRDEVIRVARSMMHGCEAETEAAP